MNVTAKTDYAVRAVAELGAAEGRLVKADRIAQAQEIQGPGDNPLKPPLHLIARRAREPAVRKSGWSP